MSRTGHMIILGLFVDDMIISYTLADENEWLEIKRKMMEKYELSDMGEARVILGMRITKHDGYTYIDQQNYTREKLNEFGLSDCIESPIPGDSSVHNRDKIGEVDRHKYMQIVGSLIYAHHGTRPDITHSTNIVCRYMSQPNANHMQAAVKILRYMKGTVKYGLKYKNDEDKYGNEVEVTGYCDADWGGHKNEENKKSTTGYCVFMNGNLISWRTHKQETTASSSTEAELNALHEVWKEVKWMCMLLSEMGCRVRRPSTIYCDNQSTILIAKNDTQHERTKHIDIKKFLIRDEIKGGEIRVEWVSSSQQKADIFTKQLNPPTFLSLRQHLVHEVNVSQ
jgi:hypothetical protein